MNFNKLNDESEFNEMLENKKEHDLNPEGKTLKDRLANTIRDVQVVYCPSEGEFIVGQITAIGPIGTAENLEDALQEYLEIQSAVMENILQQQVRNKSNNLKKAMSREPNEKEFV